MGRAGNRTLGVLSVLMLFALISCSRGAENIEKSGEKILSHSTYSGDAGSIGIISKWEARERRLKIIYLVFVLAAVFIVFSVSSGGLVRHRARVFEASIPGGANGLPPPEELKKNLIVAFILWFLLWPVGGHRAYLLKPISAACMCLCFLGAWVGFFFWWPHFLMLNWELYWIVFLSCFLWWIADGLMIQGWVNAHNREVDALYVASTEQQHEEMPSTSSSSSTSAPQKSTTAEVEALRARVAELEAELNRKNAALAEFAMQKRSEE